MTRHKKSTVRGWRNQAGGSRKLFPVVKSVYLTEATDRMLARFATLEGKDPAELAREIIERGLLDLRDRWTLNLPTPATGRKPKTDHPWRRVPMHVRAKSGGDE